MPQAMAKAARPPAITSHNISWLAAAVQGGGARRAARGARRAAAGREPAGEEAPSEEAGETRARGGRGGRKISAPARRAAAPFFLIYERIFTGIFLRRGGGGDSD
jgi:hypothetical protein